MTQGWRQTFYQTCTELLVRFGWIKRSVYSAEQLSELMLATLPQSFDLPIPRGSAQLNLVHGELTIPPQGHELELEFLAEFTIDMLANRIYQAHLSIGLRGQICFDKQSAQLQLCNIRLDHTRLMSDNYALIKDGHQLLTALLPAPVKGILSATVNTTLDVLGNTIMGDLHQYLSLYINGNKQKVLDYHLRDIESTIIDFSQRGKLSYALDTDDFEEGLFARYGQRVTLENGQLVFVFHPDD